MIFLNEVAKFLDYFFEVAHYDLQERGGVYLPTVRVIQRLGLVLEPWDGLYEWVDELGLDALFLHRPWKLENEKLLPEVGVISYHLPFDEQLTLGFNPLLAKVLSMSNLEVLGKKQNRAIGMIGNIPNHSLISLCKCISEIFAGYEQIQTATQIEVKRIAVVGAMTDLLVREAAQRGADIYITGQLRQPAIQAMVDTQIGVITIGHFQSEVWGLRSLAGILRQRWSNLDVICKY
jgi:putative NIF3 family GTP cyclohydrolase 1 type 2